MANYASTRRSAIQYKMTDLMNTPEMKRKESAVLKMLLNNGQSLIAPKERALINEVKKTDSDTVEVSILNKQASAAVTGRSTTHAGAINDSTKATLSFITRGQKFKYSLKQADRDSVYSLLEMNAKQFMSAIGNLHDTLETYYLTWLNTNRSQVVNTPSIGTWDGTNFIYGVADGDQNLMFQQFKGFMREQYYKGQMQLVSNEFITQKGEYLSMQGGQNSANLGWQLSDINNFASTEVSNETGFQGQGFILPYGTVGLESWIPEMNKAGHGSPFQTGGAYYSIDDPFGTGLRFAVHEYAVGADNQTLAGESQDIDINVEITIDTAPVKAIETTANSTPIYKVGVKTT